MSDTVRVGVVIAALFAAAAVNAAWLPLWFSDHGLSPADIGMVLGGASLLRVVGVPGGGWVADRLGRRRPVILVAAGLACVAASVLPGLDGVAPVMLAAGVVAMCGALLTPLLDAVTLALAGAGRLDYGRTRAWGSVAYMAATAGAGLLLAWTGTWVVPGLIAVGYGATLVGARALPDVEVGRRGGGGGGLDGVVGRAALRWTVVASALVQGSHAAYYGFAAVHWRGAGISDGVIGLLIAEGIVVEIGLFVWGRRLVERVGPAGLTAIAAGAGVVRWTVTAVSVDVGVLAVVQVLHSATFACQHLATMQVMRRVPAERAGMGQAVVSALGYSLPTAVLSWATGRLYGSLGGLVFLPMAGVAGAALLVAPRLGRALRG